MNKNNAAFEYDQVNIICPVYQPGTYDEDAEKYIIYNVSARFVSNRNARNLALDTGRKIVTSPSVYPGPPPYWDQQINRVTRLSAHYAK